MKATSVKKETNEFAATIRDTLEKPERRNFSAKYKRDILVKVDACRQNGEIGALLRREGLYATHLATWRKQRAAGEIDVHHDECVAQILRWSSEGDTSSG